MPVPVGRPVAKDTPVRTVSTHSTIAAGPSDGHGPQNRFASRHYRMAWWVRAYCGLLCLTRGPTREGWGSGLPLWAAHMRRRSSFGCQRPGVLSLGWPSPWLPLALPYSRHCLLGRKPRIENDLRGRDDRCGSGHRRWSKRYSIRHFVATRDGEIHSSDREPYPEVPGRFRLAMECLRPGRSNSRRFDGMRWSARRRPVLSPR